MIGPPLALLVGLWVLGRVAMLFDMALGAAAAAVDSAFLVVFAALIWREVVASRNWRNAPVCVLVTAFAAANLIFHLGGGLGRSRLDERLALSVVAVLIALIGGRIVPNFTRNWLKARGENLRAVGGLVDQTILGLTCVAVGAWVLAPDISATGVLLCLAGLANLARLARWNGWRTRSEPLLWSLHLGYGWLGLSLALLGASVLTPAVARTAGVHALTAGAIGVMTLAIMTRVSRGHTGRRLAADRPTTALYVFANLAAAVRVAAPFSGGLQMDLLAVSATLWALAFGGFALLYGPMLATPRRAPAPGAA